MPRALPGEEGKLIVQVEDTLIGKQRRMPVDMVDPERRAWRRATTRARWHRCSAWGASSTASSSSATPSSTRCNTMTEGIFIAGACQGPMAIPETVAQGAAAAARVLSLISQGTVMMEPVRAHIDEERCSGCRICNNLCPYNAIVFHEDRKVSEVITALCQGCGTCVAACPSAAITGAHFTDEQVMAQIEGMLVGCAATPEHLQDAE